MLLSELMGEPGLRERKKARTRREIAEVALALFAERGFEAVPVAEIARRAEVSEATVFNYFRTKEDLIFAGMSDYDEALVTALRERPAGESVVAAFRAFLLAPHGLLNPGESPPLGRIATVARVIGASPSLQARGRQIADAAARKVAEQLAKETGVGSDDVEAWTVAYALVGAHRALVRFAWGQIVVGQVGEPLARSVRAQGERVLEVLERGLASYPLGADE